MNHFFRVDVLSGNENWLQDCTAGKVSWEEKEPKQMMHHLSELFSGGYVNEDWRTTTDGSLPYKMTGVIVNGLKKLIDWGSLNIQIVGDAKDGRKLKELILAEEPDLVITDIMMPKMTGLDVISWYREIGTKTKFAFNLYFFEEKTVINFQEIHKDYTVSFEDYEESIENAFRAIIAKDSSAMDKINDVMDNIYSIHYGNRYAAQSRTMNFTGDLNSKLYRYHLLDGDFYKIQDELQHKVENMTTFSELRICISEHYEKLLEKVYETEQNYKAYLTQIRMEAALKLLQETDYKTYEIGEQVGYNNVRRFVDAFKQIYSVSPMEYKKGLKEK